MRPGFESPILHQSKEKRLHRMSILDNTKLNLEKAHLELILLAGALQHNLSRNHIKSLIERIHTRADADIKRPQRLESLSVLEQAGYLSTYQELSQ